MHAWRHRPGAARWLALALVTIALAALPWGALGAQDSEATTAAGFIVDTGEGETRYVVVTFDEPSMTAVDLLRAADLDAVTVDFGGLGEAVCSIDRTGCDVSTCRQRVCQTGDPESPFWQYWEQDDTGSWFLSPLGASDVEVTDGDISAWVWTGVDPELAALGWEELAERAGAPESVIQGDVSGEQTVYASGGSGTRSEGGDLTETLVAAGAVAVVGAAGAWLLMRQRRRASVTP